MEENLILYNRTYFHVDTLWHHSDVTSVHDINFGQIALLRKGTWAEILENHWCMTTATALGLI